MKRLTVLLLYNYKVWKYHRYQLVQSGADVSNRGADYISEQSYIHISCKELAMNHKHYALLGSEWVQQETVSLLEKCILGKMNIKCKAQDGIVQCRATGVISLDQEVPTITSKLSAKANDWQRNGTETQSCIVEYRVINLWCNSRESTILLG